MVIALATVFKTKYRSVARRRTLKNLDSGNRPNLDLFKYVIHVLNTYSDQHHMFICRTLLVASLVLLPVLGVTWVLGVFAVNSNTTVFAWLFTIFNSLQVCSNIIIQNIICYQILVHICT